MAFSNHKIASLTWSLLVQCLFQRRLSKRVIRVVRGARHAVIEGELFALDDIAASEQRQIRHGNVDVIDEDVVDL